MVWLFDAYSLKAKKCIFSHNSPTRPCSFLFFFFLSPSTPGLYASCNSSSFVDPFVTRSIAALCLCQLNPEKNASTLAIFTYNLSNNNRFAHPKLPLKKIKKSEIPPANAKQTLNLYWIFVWENGSKTRDRHCNWRARQCTCCFADGALVIGFICLILECFARIGMRRVSVPHPHPSMSTWSDSEPIQPVLSSMSISLLHLRLQPSLHPLSTTEWNDH